MKKFFLSITLIAITGVPVFACTSWMVFSDFTKNATNILHKNRDSKTRNIAVYLSPEGAKRKWIAIGTNSTNAGVNASGLAGVMNSGEKTKDAPNAKDKKSTPALLRVILDNCDTAAQAVKKLEEMIKAGDYYHNDSGSTFFFMDTKEGYICEFTTRHFTVQRHTEKYAVRANIWQNPGMPSRSCGTFKGYLHSSARAYVAISGLNQALAKGGKITVQDVINLSRNCELPDKLSYPNRPVCGMTTNSGCTLEIDIQYPDVLSSGYVTLGHPRNTICLPIPICAEKILPSMSTYNWSNAAFDRAEGMFSWDMLWNKQAGFTAPIPETWLKFEAASMAKYADAKAKARLLLNNGKRAEAIKLLNNAAYAIWSDAEALLNLKK